MHRNPDLMSLPKDSTWIKVCQKKLTAKLKPTNNFSLDVGIVPQYNITMMDKKPLPDNFD